jgi:hypothetical protein
MTLDRLFFVACSLLPVAGQATAVPAASTLATVSVAKPVAGKPDVLVALDGSGQYTSIQEAISAAPMRTGAADPR